MDTNLASTSAAPLASAEPTFARRRHGWLRLLSDPAVIFGIVVLLIVGTSAIAAPIIAPHDPAMQSLSNRLQPPSILDGSTEHILGTDNLGRDILSRLIYGARISLLVAVVTVIIAGSFGTILGATAGYFGGIVDHIIMRVVDAWLALPFLVLAIAMVAALGAGLDKLILALILSRWVIFSRTARAEALALREREFVDAARCIGVSDRRIIFRHLLPNMLPPLFAIATLEMATVVVSEASLSFLGLGVQGTTPTWGGILADGRQYIREAWWLTTFAGAAITILVLGFNLLGTALGEYFDPRLRKMPEHAASPAGHRHPQKEQGVTQMLVPVIDAAGSDYEIGFKHGSALPELRKALLATLDQRDSQADARPHPEADRRLDAISELLARHSPATLGQIDGLAAAFGLPAELLLRSLMAGYLEADVDAKQTDTPTEGCTVWAASDVTGRQGPLLVKNRDQPADALSLQFVLRAQPVGKLSWAAVTTMGAPGVHSSGINAAGLAIADTHVPSRDLGPGLPRYSQMLHALEEHETVASAIAYLMSAPMMGGGNLVLADAAGAVAVVECGHRAHGVASRQSGTIQATNHFISAALEDAYALDPGSEATASSRGRYAMVRKALVRSTAERTPAFARSLMAYHGDGADTICRHGSETIPSQTISCVIFQPQDRTLEICHGHPCTADYRTIAVTSSPE